MLLKVFVNEFILGSLFMLCQQIDLAIKYSQGIVKKLNSMIPRFRFRKSMGGFFAKHFLKMV